MTEELPLAAIRLMGYCRDVALMSRQEFSLHYRVSLSMTAKKQLMSFPAINTQPREIEFPWHPAGYVTASQIQEASPPLANASPSSSRDGLPASLPHPETQTNPDNVGGILTSAFNPNPAPDVTMDVVQEQQPQQQEQQAQNNDNVRNTNTNRRRRRRNSADSDESFVGRARAASPARTVYDNGLLTEEIEKVQKLLTTYGPKLKHQRLPDERRTQQQPEFETERYHQLNATQETDEEELIAKIFIQIKENLALAYESEEKASYHHYVVAEKLVKLHELVGNDRFRTILTDMVMTRR